MSMKLKITISVIVVIIIIFAFTFYILSIPKTITAKEGYDYAQSLANDWSSDSKLAVIYSHEGEITNLPEPSMDASNDPNVGDGKAVYWRYVFSSELKNMTYEITISAEKKMIRAEESEGSLSHYYSFYGLDHDFYISNWNIDSDMALKKALENDKDFSTFLNTNSQVTIVIILRDLKEFVVTYPQSELWDIEYGYKEGYDVESVFVDAQDGTVLHWSDLR